MKKGLGTQSKKDVSTADVSGIEEALFSLEDMITLPQALAILKKQGFNITRDALTRWIYKYKIGVKIGGRFYVQPKELQLLLMGKK